ncbi:MAG: glycosyltransferase family 2 protein [Actinomycetota bacterium]|nr:glycosyltransferase family 2 protein [Actinomycetota bacterium]
MIRDVGVIVPAANEAQHLSDCLRAVRRSHRHLITSCRREIRVRIVVVLDSCTDDSALIAEGFRGVETVSVQAGCVGSARYAGVTHILSGRTPAIETWLANTDADSQVPPHWLAAMVEEADRGAHVVLGTVRPGPGLPSDISTDWHARHVERDGHPHVHGANFGIRTDAYLALGGWPSVFSGEDELLAARASAAGRLHVVRTGRLPVLTSTRLHGRAPHGFSSYLRGLSARTQGR